MIPVLAAVERNIKNAVENKKFFYAKPPQVTN